MIARRPGGLGLGNELDVMHVHDIEVRRVQARKTAFDAGADGSRGIVERVPRASEPSTLGELRMGVYLLLWAVRAMRRTHDLIGRAGKLVFERLQGGS